jgi:hypothetical protein
MASRSKSSHKSADVHRKAFREAVAKAEARNTRAAIAIGRHAIAYIQSRVRAVPATERGERRVERAAAVAVLAGDVGRTPEYVNRACSISEFARLVPEAAKLPFSAIRELARAVDTDVVNAKWSMPDRRIAKAKAYVARIVGKVVDQKTVRAAVNGWKVAVSAKAVAASRKGAKKKTISQDAVTSILLPPDAPASRVDACIEMGEHLSEEDMLAVLSGFANQIDRELRIALDNGESINRRHPAVQIWQQMVRQVEVLTHTMQAAGTLPGGDFRGISEQPAPALWKSSGPQLEVCIEDR